MYDSTGDHRRPGRPLEDPAGRAAKPPVGASYSGTLIGMATVTRTFLVDDLDGSTGDVENVRISLDDADFEIDLSAAKAARLREKLDRFVEHGSRVTPQQPDRRGSVSSRRCPVGIRSRRSATGPGETGMRCRPAAASPRASRTRSPPHTEKHCEARDLT